MLEVVRQHFFREFVYVFDYERLTIIVPANDVIVDLVLEN